MDYDWEKIFETKTIKELYGIYSGNSLLPNETVEYARQELERRNFDFNDIESYKSGWKLSELLIEEEIAQKVLNENKIKIIPYKRLYFLIPGILFVYIVLLKFLNINLTIYFPILMIAITLWYVPFTNRIYSKQKEKQKSRLKRINELKEKIEENLPDEKLNLIKKDIVRNIEENNKNNKVLYFILIGFVLIFLIIKIIGMIVGE